MKIRFISSPLEGKASNRIRMMTPIQGMKKLGFDGDFSDSGDKNTAIVIPKTEVNAIKKANGGKIIWDFCDNYFSDGRKTKADILIRACDAITTTTEANKKILESELKARKLKKKIYIVDDPVYYSFSEPAFFRRPYSHYHNINLVWYGYDGNLIYGDWNKHVFTPLSKLFLKFNFTFINKHNTVPYGAYKDNIEVFTVPFSTKKQWKLTRAADFVILCIDHKHPFTVGKSHNKLVDGLACGTMVLASPQESYLKFKDYAMIGNNFAENIQWCINNQEETINRIKEGQDYIKEHLSDVAVARQWIRVAEEIL